VKDTPYDIVFVERDGPALHHCAYIIPDIQAMLRACDTAGVLGWPDCVEYGPGKHALGHSYYVYLLDPDGHRVELLLPPISEQWLSANQAVVGEFLDDATEIAGVEVEFGSDLLGDQAIAMRELV